MLRHLLPLALSVHVEFTNVRVWSCTSSSSAPPSNSLTRSTPSSHHLRQPHHPRRVLHSMALPLLHPSRRLEEGHVRYHYVAGHG